MKTNVKVEISNQFKGCNIDDVSVQWTHLVHKFRRIRKIMVNKDPLVTGINGSTQHPGWNLYEHMSHSFDILQLS